MTIKHIALAVAGLLGLTSCDKYLDITPTGSQLVETTQDFYELVAWPNRGYPINNFQYLVDDQWLKESNVIGVAANMNTINFLFQDDADRVRRIASSSMYNQTYKYIGQWNNIISLVDESTGDADLKQLAKAEAKVFRAFDHFLLINVYAKAYDATTAATDGGIAIMDKYDLEAVPTKSTVQQVYDFIQKDIDEAIPYLQEKPGNVYHPSLAFAWAFKAKVHLFKREITQAKEAALKALTYNDKLFDLVDLASKGGPTVLNVPAANNPEVLSYQYITGYNEMNFGYNYIISPELTSMFKSADDKRFTLFFNTTNNSLQDAAAGTSYYVMTYTRFFYPTVGMKTPELYLMLAECYAREDNYQQAVDMLNTLRKTRIAGSDAVLTAPNTRKETMDLVINERRKELPFGYHRFFDLKRLNIEPEYAKTVVRKFPIVSTAVPQETYTLEPNSRMYIIPFPLDVMEKNPNIRLNTNEVVPF
ncbi:RagB/SusD family nutrient uptake outer membrane protein [Sphingobacterium corticibacter]|uniref:RagB/SusD family nutrient uptake outer membrane protein n=1 Tax=Sphingobacterium corticibacter TaxID=2171749 RepID=A0A2T8HME9_9SPHI|nr:RagB/SusD family nutrient uptake outer membrane protein [Sphingobacterium corticibacter]PVH26472.1 RagB/SusD family nutrient uptake outer membrane protein [Sphingobacterium corticibacter]